MNATPLPLLLLTLLLVACSTIGIEGQFLGPADATATALAASFHASPTPDLAATQAIERAVRLTLTAAVPSPTDTHRPSPTAEPTTAVPASETPIPTVTRKPTLLPTAAPTQAQAPAPQIIFLRPRCGTTYTVRADTPLEIRYGSWLARGPDLAAQNAQHLSVRLVLDGEPVAGVQQPVMPGSAFPCGASTEAYGVFFVAQVGPLSAGTHVALQTIIFDEQVTDGGDYNGDGTPDTFGPGEIGTHQFTIIAQ